MIYSKTKNWLFIAACLSVCLLVLNSTGFAQDSSATAPAAPPKVKPVKNTFQSVWLIDNQSVMVPKKGTMELDFQHRFGTVQNGYDDFWGLFAPSNIRFGVSYAPIENLFVGVGLTKSNMLWDFTAKYALMRQTTDGKYPVSITYYGNMAIDTRKDPDNTIFNSKNMSDFNWIEPQRMSFFNQIIIARKISEKLSVQVSPSISHQNAVNGYYTKNDSTGTEIWQEMKHNHFAIAFGARYKLTDVTSLIFNYDQPITQHNINNPDPNLSFGVEFNTSSHSFQLFLTNYYYLNPQRNNLFTNKQNDGSYSPTISDFMIGFNITRLWSY